MLFTLIAIRGFSQNVVPDFKANIFFTNAIDTILKQGIKEYDLIIAFRTFSNKTLQTDYRLLIYNGGKWQKKIFHDKWGSSMQLFNDSFEERPVQPGECEGLFTNLVACHLFTIEDDKVNRICTDRDTIIKGVKRTYSFGVENGTQVQLWLITHKKSRHLYFYAPELYVKYCSPPQDRQDLLKIMAMLNKGW